MLFGVVGIFSAGYTDESDEYIKQIIWLGISVAAMCVVWVTDINMQGMAAYPLYITFILLLIAVLFTTPINNATSWFSFGTFTIQPSEFMKIVYILALAKFLERIGKNSSDVNKLKNLIVVAIACAVPVLLIAIQPDFGTAVVFLSITFFMLYKAGLNYKYILLLVVAIIIIVPIVYCFVLDEYQQARILVFLNPETDPLGSGYNAIQSKLAIGSGMIFGTGLLKGVQTQFGYLPVKTSDFIFSVLSEEMGFVISIFIILLYVVLFIKIFMLVKKTSSRFSAYVLMGIFGMFFFHFVENIGMTIGLLPITGIPLPFVSYGGTNLLTSFIALGIILNISSKKKTDMFIRQGEM